MMVAVGSRVLVGRHKATVRYVGEVAQQPGTWVGLEWDEPERGKHDGSIAGRQYFTCSFASKAGSFVRSEKFMASACLGTSVSEAMSRRYQDGAPKLDMKMYALTAARRKVDIQLVGEDSILQHYRLMSMERACLRDSAVACVGPAGELRRTAPQLQDLDLSANLISDWCHLAQLAEELLGLNMLDLSENRIAPSSMPALSTCLPFKALRVLVLNSCCLTWPQVLQVMQLAPSLEELHLCNNKITSIGGVAGLAACKSLQVLNLDNNCIVDWGSISALGSLPALTCLHLGGNRISHLEHNGQQAGAAFLALRSLLLADNALDTWESVDEFQKFPALKEVRLTGNPVFADHPRFEVIARVASLTMLNGSTVSSRERAEAELRYLRRIHGELDSKAMNVAAMAAVQAAHPRLAELEARLGMVGSMVMPKPVQKALGAGLVEVILTSCASGAPAKLQKRLPGSLLVGKLKVLSERLFGIPVAQQTLTLRSSGCADARAGDVLQEDDRPLSYYDLKAGCVIDIVDSSILVSAA